MGGGTAGDLASFLYLGIIFELALHPFGTAYPFLVALLLGRNNSDLVAIGLTVRANGCFERSINEESPDWMVWYCWCLRISTSLSMPGRLP